MSIKRKVTEIKESELDQIFNKIAEGDDQVLGWYYFNDLKILVYSEDITKKRYNIVKSLFKKLKEEGRCLYCGTMVNEINPHTKKPYCKCQVHRKMTSLIIKRNKLIFKNASKDEIKKVEEELSEIKKLDKELREKEKKRRKEDRERNKI